MNPATTVRVGGTGRLARRLAPLVDAAQACVARNIVPGRTPGDPALFLRAGGGYDTPWTRDAAINTWQAAAWLAPEVARDTLGMVLDPDGERVVWDTQWWDQAIWIVGARELALVTGDRDIAEWGHRIGVATLAWLDERCLDRVSGLYRGPAVMADGITGYPQDLHDPDLAGESFVLEHRATHRLHSLSTNALYVMAMAALADLAEVVGADPRALRRRSAALAERVRDRFWVAGEQRFGYLLGDGQLTGGQEGLGLALAILSGTATPDQARATVAGVQHAPRGLSAVWPSFEGYDVDHFGRHGAALWPMIMGVWAQAVAATGDTAAFGAELDRLCSLFESSDPQFFEVYHPVTGVPDGGWQAGRQWRSEPDQTWSATTLIGTVLHGLAGLRPTPSGLELHPCLPPDSGELRLVGVPWQGELLDVDLNTGVIERRS
ncbi:MAG: MGH1-like glycoside hydrolase domain-containing protein [Propionicimonas sp.]